MDKPERIQIYLVYTTDSKQKLTAAIIDDRDLVLEAAARAIRQAHAKAREMMAVDKTVGEIRTHEARHLKTVLRRFLPELDQK